MKLPARCLALHILTCVFIHLFALKCTQYYTHTMNPTGVGVQPLQAFHILTGVLHIWAESITKYTHTESNRLATGVGVQPLQALHSWQPLLHKARHNKTFSNFSKCQKRLSIRLPVDGADYFILLTPWLTQVVASCQNISHFLSFSFVRSKTLFLKCQCMLEYNSIHFFNWANKDSTLATSLWFHQLSSGPGGASTYSLFGRCETSIISSIGRLFNGMKLFFQLLYTKARWRSSSCPPPPPQSPPQSLT